MKDLLVRFARKTKNIVKRSQPLALAAGLLAGVVASSLPINIASAAAVQNLTPAPRVSFTFDDGFVSSLTKAAPTLAKYNLAGTNYVITDCVGLTAPNDCAADGTRDYMSWEQIRELQNTYGWEIGSHTASHPLLSTLTTSQIEAEMVNSRQALVDNGVNATNIAFPYGDYNNEVLAQAAKYYESARGFADTDAMNGWPYNANLLYDQQVQSGAPAPVWSLCTDMTVAGVKACIDQAVANNQWLILTFHDILDTPDTSSESYDYSTAELDAIAAYAKEKQDAGSLKVVNVADGLVRGTNLLPNGDFTSGLGSWTTDAPANITADNGNNGRYPDPTNSVLLTSNASTDSHFFSPKVAVAHGKTYLLKNYLSMLNGGSVYFAVDEYDADGNWISWVDPNTSRAFSAEENPINAGEVSFTYTPTSANVASASLQVIVRANTNVQAYLDGSQWYDTGETTVVTPPTDTTPPVISDVVISNITETGATITWTTDEASDSTVNYGFSGFAYTDSIADSTLSTSHSITLTGLTSGGSYHIEVVSKDAASNVATSQEYLFVTTIPTIPDTTPPVMAGVSINMVSNTNAVITWTTNESSYHSIDYGTTNSYGTQLQGDVTTVAPSFSLGNLLPATLYYFQLTSVDIYGNTSTHTGTFTTPSALVGDIDGNGKVDDDDATILFANWGDNPLAGDIDNNGVVDDDDATILFANWSK
jgi:peptidoglycan/xylan/chitin deacetylase (PgdA/CDA1 family)